MLRRKNLRALSLTSLAGCLVFAAVYFWFPRSYNVTLQGVKYQLGPDNSQWTKPVAIRIEGKVRRGLTGTKTFKGTIDIDGEEIPVPEDQRMVIFRSSKNGFVGSIVYAVFEKGNVDLFGYGYLFAKEDFSEVTINVYEQGEEGNSSRGWTSQDGWMISAPAETRAEALELSEELMRDYLGPKDRLE